MLSALGLTVVRHIPVQYIGGILTGAYSLHGGVIRDGGGRILAHLMSGGAGTLTQVVPGASLLSSAIANGQLYYLGHEVAAISAKLSTVLTVTSAAATLSGLGLVANIAGYAFIHKRLDLINSRLNEIGKTVKRIERLLKTERLALLRAAVVRLHHAEQATVGETKRGLLLQAMNDFANLSQYYLQLWGEPPEEDIALLNLLDDYYTLSFLGHALAASELSMSDVAAEEFEKHGATWLDGARMHLKKILADEETVLFYNATADQFSSSEFTDLMDFVNDEQRGFEWVDEIKKKKKPLFSAPPPEDLVRLCKKLPARGKSLQAEQAHLRLLAEKNVSASTFARETDQGRVALGVDAACVLPLPRR